MRDIIKRGMRDLFEIGQRVGFDVLPRHFYSSIPDIRELRTSENWKQPHSMHGVSGADLDDQVAFLNTCCEAVPKEPRALPIYERACKSNGAIGYGPIEAGVLDRFVSWKRPRRVLQIGAGVSTAVVLNAAEAVSHDLLLTCIDPYPTDYLRAEERAGRITLLEDRAQSVPLKTFLDLSAGDLLFVDSTHTVKPGSEVNRIILEILPRLALGTHVHFHDIYFPFDHAPNILSEDLFFWNETPLLLAFLTGNASVRMNLSLAMVNSARPEALQQFFTDYKPHAPQAIRDGTLRLGDDGHFPSSVFLEVVP